MTSSRTTRPKQTRPTARWIHRSAEEYEGIHKDIALVERFAAQLGERRVYIVRQSALGITLKEIAAVLNVTPARVRVLRDDTLLKARRYARVPI